MAKRFTQQTLKDAKLQVRRRESFQCKLTRGGAVSTKIAYIVPSALQNQDNGVLEKEEVWTFLESFWGEEKVSKWKQLLLDGSEMNAYQIVNLMNLDLIVERYWAFGLIALRPISVNLEQTEMKVAFHWLPFREQLWDWDIKRKDKVSMLQNPLQDPQYRPVSSPGRQHFVVVRREDDTFASISSGYTFTLSTDNNDQRPLPSFDLLELRWHLSRIAAFQGTDDDERSYSPAYDCQYNPESDSE
ncbi:unnamed protein product [Penicillium salamii]|uniref:HNH nuclease domain-containing protein n=1 Tax=Penicillium salamii TaxID=1612424 RepID=A0A9W4NI86_9EURO|nr:unnamed protein product [Penicillium salamii]